ncbi:MAG: SdrD B-like domain-containing protein, partial [Tepidisphaeraceae bacterium]
MPVVSIAATDSPASELTGHHGVFTVSRTGASNVPLGVSLFLSPAAGQATNGVDYELIPLSAFIPAGQSSVSFDIIPIPDSQIEGSESITITIGESSLYSFGATPSATVQIADGPNIDLNTVTGRVFDDRNGNGLPDTGEPGLVGRQVFFDINNDGIRQGGEPLAVTDASGNYSLGGLPGGTHSIVLSPEPGYVFTTSPAQSVSVGIGQLVSGADSGSAQPVVVQGTVFVDSDLDGTFDSGEATLGGWTVFVDQDFDGALDPTEPSAMSDGAGAYLVTGAVPGTLHLRASGPAGWTPTNGDTGGAVAVTATGGQSISGINLGQRRSAPSIASLTPSAPSVSSGSILTLEASNVDPTTSIVRLYLEDNGVAGLQTGTGGDTALKVDYDAVDDWGIVLRAGLNAGTHVFYAIAEDGYRF